jgi:hypothetical protein
LFACPCPDGAWDEEDGDVMTHSSATQRQHLIFLHVPKAGGSTLHAVLDRYYRPGEVYHVGGGRTLETMQGFEAIPRERRESVTLLRGHVRYGVHELFSGPSRYVTFLRDPVERIVSFYKYARRSPTNHIHSQIRSRNMSLADVMAAGLTTELNNGQVRRLAGYDRFNDVYGFGDCPPELLDIALANIDRHFSLVGFIEKFDESLLLLASILGWRIPPYYARKNVSRGSSDADGIDERTLDVVRQDNLLDLRLYEVMMDRFLDICAKREDFDDQVARFRHWNGRLALGVRTEGFLRRGARRLCSGLRPPARVG